MSENPRPFLLAENCRKSCLSVNIMVHTALVLNCGISGKKQYWKLAIQNKKLQEGKIMSPNCFVPQEITCSDTLMELFVALDHQWIIIIRSRLPASSFWQKLPAVTSACSPSHLCHHYRAWDNNNKKKINQKAETNPTWWIITVRKVCVITNSLFHSESYIMLLQLIVINA